MFSKLFEGSELLTLPVISMVIFATSFALVTLIAWRAARKDPEGQARLAALPLDDGEAGGAR